MCIVAMIWLMFFFFFFKQKTAYEMLRSLVGSEMCIRDSPGAAQDGLVGDRLQRVLTELQLHAIELEKASVLADQGVLRLGQDADHRLPTQLGHTRDHRQPADELWDHAVLEQVLRHHVGEDVAAVDLVLRVQYGAEADRLLADPSLDHLVQAGEGATDDEQHVGGAVSYTHLRAHETPEHLVCRLLLE